MKKSVEILGLPVISITEGRELGMSKSLLVDAKNGAIAAITIEDEDWYRGVKLLPYSSVIAIGNDAVTVTNSENILTLDHAGDYEAMLDANIQIIGTKAITKSGIIQGRVVEIYVGDSGNIEKCEIQAADGSLSEIMSDQISIFGKQVTVLDAETEKKTEIIAEVPPTPEVKVEKVVEKPAEEPVKPVEKAPEPVVEPQVKPQPEVVKPAAKPAVKPQAPANVPQQPQQTPDPAIQMADKASEERHRRFLLGKKVTRQITNNAGVVIVEEGATVTEAVLQKVKMANKFIELSMNVQ